MRQLLGGILWNGMEGWGWGGGWLCVVISGEEAGETLNIPASDKQDSGGSVCEGGVGATRIRGRGRRLGHLQVELLL